MNAPFSYSSPTLSVEALKHSIAYKLMFTIGKDPVIANKHEWLNATLFAVRDRLVERWLRSNRAQLSQETRQVYYLSMEFLIGRTLSNALLSLGIYDDVKTALEEMGLDLEELIDEENDPGLGNGGLGRLAACFLDSMATLELPSWGYGMRYEYGMFAQSIINGAQVEHPDAWLVDGTPWEFPRPGTCFTVNFGGSAEHHGEWAEWNAAEAVEAGTFPDDFALSPVRPKEAGSLVHLVEAARVDVERRKPDSGDSQIDVPFALDHGEVPHPAEHPVGDTRCTT